MAAEGGYAVSGQFNAIADSAASAVLNIQKLATEFAAFSASVGSVTTSIKAFADLQQTLILTNSIAGGTAKELQNMNDAVRNMALGFKFSATEGAQALYFLSSAGFSVQQSLSAMNGVALLAQATLTDLAQTSDTIANTLASFNLEADQSTRVANLFAAAISVTQATMDKLSYSMRYVGPVAAEMGASVEQTVVALSGLYQVGNRGQQAGTLLRDVLIRLVNPSAEAATVLSKIGVSVADTDGKVRNFVDILKDLQKVNLSPISLAKIFEQRGVAGASTLLQLFDAKDFERRIKDTNGSLTEFGQQVKNVADKAGRDISTLSNMWEYLELAETNTNFATKLALQQNATLSSSFSRAANAVKELGIAFGEQLAPGMQAIANTLTSMAVGFRNLDDGTKKLIGDLPFVVVGVLGAVKAWGLLVSMVERATTAFGNVRNSASTIGNFFRGTPTAGVAAGAAAAAGAGGALTLNTARLEAEILLLRGVLTNTNAELVVLNAGIGRLIAVMAVPAASRGLAATAPGAVFSQVPRAPVPPPIPNAVTGAAASAATTAATSAGAAVGAGAALRAAGGVIAAVLAGITGIVGIVLTAVSLAGLVALAWPLVKDYLNKQPGKASFQAKDFSGEVDQSIASINQQPISPFKKSQNLQTVAEGLGDEYKFFQEALKDSIKSAKDADAALKEYVASQLELKGNGDQAKKVREDVSGSLAKVFANDVRFSNDTKFKDLKATYDNASRDVDNANKSLKDYSVAAGKIAAEQQRLASLPSFKIEQNAAEQAKKLNTGGGKIVILDAYIKELEKEARDAQTAARKAELALRNDPVQQFLGEVADTLQSNANKIKSFGDKIEKDVQGGTSNLKSVLANIKGYGPGDFAKIISGQGYSYFNDAGEIVNVKGIAEQVAAGIPIDQVIAAYKQGYELFVQRADIKSKDIQTELNAVTAAFDKFINGIAKEQKAQLQTKIFAMIQQQEANEEFANKLRDTYSKIQEGYITTVSTAIGDAVPQLKLRVDLGSLERSLRDQLAEIRKQRIELIKKAGAESGGLTPEENAAKIQAANNWATSTANAAQQQYYQQVRNRVAEAVAAQKRIGDEIKLAQASARTTQAQLNSDLADLYARFGMKIPQQVFNSAADLEFAQTDQKIQQTINDLKQKIETLTKQRQELDRYLANPSAATVSGTAPKLSVEVTGGPTDKMLDAMTKGTADFSAKFGLDLSNFTKGFNDTLQKFLLDFSSAIGKPITVQTPQQQINSRFGSFAAPNGSGLPSEITNGTSRPVQAPAPTALPFSGTTPTTQQPWPVQIVPSSTGGTSGQQLTLSQQDIVNIAKVVQTESGQNTGQMAKAEIDVILNRLASGQWGSDVNSVLNAPKQFSAISGNANAYGSVDNAPVASAKVQQFVEQYLAERASGTQSSIGGNLNFLNPNYSSQSSLNAWGYDVVRQAQQSGYIYGNGRGDDHYYGTAKGLNPVDAGYGINLPNGTGAAANVPDPAKIAEATSAYQSYLAIVNQGTDATKAQNSTLVDIAKTQMDVNQLEQTSVQTAQQQRDAKQAEINAAREALQTAQQTQEVSRAGQLSPDQRDIAAWQEYSKVVQEASRSLAGSNDMMRGFQVANAQMATQLGRDAKLASDVYQTAANSIATNLTALITGTQKDWRVALKNIATDIATTIIKALILRALTGLGGSLFGSVGGANVAGITGGGGGLLGSAKGTAYDMGGQITPFATGGVFDSPTGFDYMSGGRRRKGVMGEAGPEAIMPLVRGPDGKLAIRALSTPITPINPGGSGGGGGGYVYSPSFTFMGSDGSTSNQPNSGSRQERNRMAAMQKELDREMESTVVRVIGKHSRNGGFLNPSAQRLGLAGGN